MEVMLLAEAAALLGKVASATGPPVYSEAGTGWDQVVDAALLGIEVLVTHCQLGLDVGCFLRCSLVACGS